MDNWFIKDEEKTQLAALLVSELEREIAEQSHLEAMMTEAIDELSMLLLKKK